MTRPLLGLTFCALTVLSSDAAVLPWKKTWMAGTSPAMT